MEERGGEVDGKVPADIVAQLLGEVAKKALVVGRCVCFCFAYTCD